MPESFDSIEFLTLARGLARQSQSEASLRTAVNRAYYAIFLIVRDKARLQGKERLHERAKEAIEFKEYAAAGHFESLRRMRVQADYFPVTNDPSYEDWLDNWKLADYCASELVEFLRRW